MASTTTTIAACEPADYAGGVALPRSSLEARWYAAYTCAHHEKRVAAELGAREVQHFLPLYSSVRRWKDRRVEFGVSLFFRVGFFRVRPGRPPSGGADSRGCLLIRRYLGVGKTKTR